MSQKSRIRNYLELGNKLTPLDAQKKFGCLRLAARIKDLRDEGLPIVTDFVGSGNSVYAQYHMEGRV